MLIRPAEGVAGRFHFLDLVWSRSWTRKDSGLVAELVAGWVRQCSRFTRAKQCHFTKSSLAINPSNPKIIMPARNTPSVQPKPAPNPNPSPVRVGRRTSMP